MHTNVIVRHPFGDMNADLVAWLIVTLKNACHLLEWEGSGKLEQRNCRCKELCVHCEVWPTDAISEPLGMVSWPQLREGAAQLYPQTQPNSEDPLLDV